MGPAVGAGSGPGAFLPEREPGAEPGRRSRRMEGGGDGKPDSGRPVRRLPPPPPRPPPTRLSSGGARGRQLGRGPAQLAGLGRRGPACWGWRGRRASRRRERPAPRLPLALRNPGARGARPGAEAGRAAGTGAGCGALGSALGSGLAGSRSLKREVLKAPAWWRSLVSLLTFSPALLFLPTPIFSSHLFCVLQ